MTIPSSDALYFGANETLFGLAVFAGLVLSTELGFRIARRRPPVPDVPARSQVGALQGSMLGLLALLLGFSFQMAQSRYDFRRLLTLDESNALGTTFLRSQMLPASERGRVDALLRRYVDARIEFYRLAGASRHVEIAPEVREPSETLQDALWAEATSAAAHEPQSLPVSLFITSLNQLIDLHERRLVALETRVPGVIITLLLFVAAASFLLVGYGYSGAGRRHAAVAALAALVVAAVITLIVDLDRPLRGHVQIGQATMLRLRDSIAHTPPPD